jgi:predicted Zn-dependent protease
VTAVRSRAALVGFGIFGAALVAAVAAAYIRAAMTRPPVPNVADLGPLAPEVRPLMEEALAALRQDRRDGARWARFGMICEANGFHAAAPNAYRQATIVQPSEAKWWYRLAFAEARTAQFDDAIRDIRRAIDLLPSYGPAQWRLGLWLLDRNDTDAAERAFTRARDADPRSMAPGIGLARVYLQRGDDQRALDILKQTLSRHPNDRYAMQLLGRAYRRIGQVNEAEFAQALSSEPEPAWADPWTEEVDAFERIFALRVTHASRRFLANPTQASFAQLEQLRAERPDDVALLSDLGEVYVEARRLDVGVPLLEGAVAKDPQRFEAFISLASAYLERNDLPRARTAIDRAVAIHPTLGRAHEIRGAVLSRAGDTRGALEALQLAVRYDPRSTRAMVWKGRMEMQLVRPAEAQESFTRATRQDPTVAEGWLGLADAAIALGAPDRAAAAIEQASRFNPSNQVVKDAGRRLATLRR